MINTEQEAINRFKELIAENGFTDCQGNTVYTLQLAAELDYDDLNQFWANWIDGEIEAGYAPEEAQNWDWE